MAVRNGFRLFKIFGIQIHIDPSWIFIFFLVTWSLSMGVFPSWHPDWGAGLSWIVGIIASLLFFLSVLLHELAHSLVAKARGLPVRRITLFLFGGVSNIEREPPSPGTEFLMAVVGPVTSIVLGGVFLLFSEFLSPANVQAADDPVAELSRLGPIPTLLMWLGSINVLVGIFNLIPGFPLDGGRLLRAGLWAATNNLMKATKWATRVGQLVGWLFILLGIAMAFGARVPFFGSGFISGLWLAFIGWFLNNAAVSSREQIVIQDVLEDVPVSRLMRSDVPTVPSNISISALVMDQIMGSDEHAFPVVDNGHLAGLVCLHDVRKLPRDQWEGKTVADIMTPADKLLVVSPGNDAAEALKQLHNRDVNQLPVLENGQLVGLLRRRDIIRWLQLHSELVGT